MYQIRIQDSAARELAQLDKQVARRVVKRIRWLAANVEAVKPDALSGDLAGLYKLRVGDYRIVYEVLHSEQVKVVEEVSRPPNYSVKPHGFLFLLWIRRLIGVYLACPAPFSVLSPPVRLASESDRKR